MAKEYVCGKTARKKLGCNKDFFMNLVNTGAIDAKRTETGGWRVSTSSINEYLAANKPDLITELDKENQETYTRFISDREHYDFLIENIRKASCSVHISTANLKRFSIGETEAKASSESFIDILEELVSRGVEIRIMCSSPSSGFLNEMGKHEMLMNNSSFHFKTCMKCHMKLVIIDGQVLYVGSANITAAGMGPRIDSRRNFEAGIITSETNLVKQGIDIFEGAWSKKRCKKCYYKTKC